MNLSEPAVLLTALFLLYAGLSIGLTWAKARNRRTGTRTHRTPTRPVPTCLADPAVQRDLDTCRDLIHQFDCALNRVFNEVADGGHDEGAIALLEVLNRAGVSGDRLEGLIDTLAWLAVYDDLHGDHGPDPSRRERGLARLAARCGRRVGRRYESDTSVTQ